MGDFRSTIERRFATVRSQRQSFLAAPSGARPAIIPAKPFANPNSGHASDFITLLVRESTLNLDILAKHLGSRTHSASRLRGQLALQPELQVRILVEGGEEGPIYPTGEIDWTHLQGSALPDLLQGADWCNDPLIALDGDEAPGRIAVRVLPVSSDAHFIVSDGFAYRIEWKHETAEGMGNEKDPETAGELVQKFNALWDLSVPAHLAMTHAA